MELMKLREEEAWKRIWEKAIALAKTYYNWKNGMAGVQTFSRRKTELYNGLMRILHEQKGWKK